MKQLSYFVIAVFGTLILGACSTSNNVVGGGIFQKRKYTGGIYWDRNQKLKTSDETELDIFRMEEESQEKYVSTTSLLNDEVTNSDDHGSGDVSAVMMEGRMGVSPAKTTENTESKSNFAGGYASSVSSENQQTISAKNPKLRSVKPTGAPAADVSTILLVIIALIIPPLAVFLFEGATSHFWIDLVLALVGLGVGFWLLGSLAWVCGLVAVIYALLIVLSVI